MDQTLDSSLTVTPPAPFTPSEVMSSTETTDTNDTNDPNDLNSTPSAPSAAESPQSSPGGLATPPKRVFDDRAAAEPMAVSENSTPHASEESSPAEPTPTDAVNHPVAPVEADDSAADSEASAIPRQQPIPPASEPMQYRAIGLVRGKYIASDEQFTRGVVETEEGVQIGAVLLGRVMSLVRKHLDLEQPHLWVVYPRTREKGDSDLHVQIVGVWEPEKLNRTTDADAETDADAVAAETDVADDADDTDDESLTENDGTTFDSTAFVPGSELDDKYFSVRGEIIYQSIEEKRLLVKIRRIARSEDQESKAFKVALRGTLEGKAVGYFWDLNVQRQGNELFVQDGTMIGVVPPQKRSKSERGGGGRPPYRRNGGGRPGGAPNRKPRWNAAEGQPRPRTGGSDRPSPPRSKGAISKPVIKRRQPDNNEEG